jgi:hypothetical protein
MTNKKDSSKPSSVECPAVKSKILNINKAIYKLIRPDASKEMKDLHAPTEADPKSRHFIH